MFGEPSSSVFATANGRSMSDLDLEQWLSMPLDFGASTPQASANDAGHSMFGMTSMSPKSGLNSTPAPSLAVHPFQSPSLPGAGEVRKSSVSRGKARAIPVTCGRVGGCGAEDCCLSGLVGSVGKSPSSTSARSLANQQQQKPPASGVPSSQMQGIVTLEDIAAITMGASAFSSGDSGNHPTLTANPPSTSHMSPLQATPASSCASSSLQLVLPSGSRAPEESALARIIPGLFPVTTASSFEHMYRTPSLQDSPMSFAPGPGSTAHSSPAPSMLGAGSTSSPATTAPPSKIDPDRPQCSNCEAFRTPLWRRDPENRLLCNACGLYQKLHKRSRPKVLKSAFQHHPDCVAPISHPCQSQGCKLDADENPTLCANCGTSTTPLWRKDEQGNPNCNACGLWRSLHGTARPVRMRMDHIRKRQRAEDKRPRKASGYQMESGRSAEDSGGMPSPAAIQQQQTPIATPGVGTPNTTSFTFSQPSTPLPGSPLAHQYPQQPQQQQQPHVVPSSTSTTDSLAGLAAMSSGIPIIAHPTPHGIALQCPHTGQAWFFPNGGAGGAVPSQQPPQQQQMQQQQKSPEEARSPGSELSNMFGNSNMEMPVFGPSAATVTHSPWDTPAAAATPAHAPTSMTAEEGEMLTSMQRGLTATTSASTMMDVDLEDDASKSLQGAFSQVRRGGAATASGKKAGDEEEDGKQQQQQGNKGRKLWWTIVA
jgi:GATA zinc finger